MRAAVLRSRPLGRPAAVLTAAAATAVLAGCGGGSAPGAAGGGVAGAASPVASTAPAAAGSSDLAEGLLPADAFGPGATVVPVTLAELQQRLAAMPGGLGGALAGVQVSPPECATALQAVAAGLGGVTGMAGEGARTGDGGAAEALVTGSAVRTATGSLRSVVQACPQVTVTSPKGSASVTLSSVDLPAIGAGATAVQATAVLTRTGSAPQTVSGLLAAVQDPHDRLLLLATAAPGDTAPDRASFTSLLQRAFDTESHALG